MSHLVEEKERDDDLHSSPSEIVKTSTTTSKASFDPVLDKFFKSDCHKNTSIVVDHLTIETTIANSLTYSKHDSLDDADNLFGTSLRSTNIYKDFFNAKKNRVKLINDLQFKINSGELVLVLGKPKNTNTLLLQKLVEHVEDPNILKNNITSENQLVFTAEMDNHFPHLTVDQTITFALDCSAGNLLTKEDKLHIRDLLLENFEMPHTLHTKVGDDYTRGVSGGERRRVTIIEALLTNASVLCLDNSTKGLDSSTALNYISFLKKLAYHYDKSFVLTLYQGSQNIFNLFDKVVILFNGYQIYCGPASKVDAYFEKLGIFKVNERQTTLELVDLIVDDSISFETKNLKYDCDNASIPKTPAEFHEAWLQSNEFKEYNNEITEFKANLKPQSDQKKAKVTKFQNSLIKQFHYCFNRNLKNNTNNKRYYISQLASQIFLAICIGTLFLRLDMSTQGSFSRGSLIFFCLLLYTFIALSEVKMNFGNGLVTHVQSGNYCFYANSIECITSVAAAIPFQFISMIIFLVIFYFLTNLNSEAGDFFAFWLLLFMADCADYLLFHMAARLSPTIAVANSIAGLILLWVAMYASYVIQMNHMHPWFKWLAYLNPLMYGFEALLCIQLHGKIMDCSSIIPSGNSFYDAFDLHHKVCAWQGASLGNDYVRGDEYLASAFGYTYDHVWRNFGILIAFFIGLLAIEMTGIEILTHFKKIVKHTGLSLYFIERTPLQEASHEIHQHVQDDVTHLKEKIDAIKQSTRSGSASTDSINALHHSNDTAFHWKNVQYTLDNGKVLLNEINGFVKPGEMVSLMGGSGTGKTTLLNALSERFSEGFVSGDISLTKVRQAIGYVEQQDILTPELTVRELFTQSALLRRSDNVPEAEKLKYVDYIIELLDLKSFEDAQIGAYSNESSTGLSLEQRKKVSLGIELVAKPSSVLFVDEPTSGLDNQSAYNIVKVLRNIADSGQGILCTIHQPSPTLFDEFDKLLLLQKGGHQVYYGPTSQVLEYFERYAFRKCGATENVAEYIIDVAQNQQQSPEKDDNSKDEEIAISSNKELDWNKIWLESDMYKSTIQNLDVLISKTAGRSVEDDQFKPISYFKQFSIIMNRTSMEFGRNYKYLSAKMGLFIVSGLFIGFTFWKTNYSVIALQTTMFAIFMVLCCCAPLMHQIQDRCVFAKHLYELRDSKTNSYHWSILPVTQIIVEIFASIIGATISFLCFYFTWNINNNSNRTGEFYLNYAIMFQLYYVTLAVLILYISPDEMISSLLVSVVFAILVLFCGAMQPYNLIPAFWKYLVYYSTPVTYFFENLMTIVFQDRPVKCAIDELALLSPPEGMTCGAYLDAYISETGGYLITPENTVYCSFCTYAKGQEFTKQLHMDYGHIWRNFGISWIYIVFNVASCLSCYWLLQNYPIGKTCKHLIGKFVPKSVANTVKKL